MEPRWMTMAQEAVLSGNAAVDPTDAFWDEKIRWARAGDVTPDGRRVARVHGKHYVLGTMKAHRPFLGHGGHLWRFRFADGTEVESNDVWAQGDIPLKLRSGALADNADVVRRDYGSSSLLASVPDLPPGSEMLATMGNLSRHEHPTYAVNFEFQVERNDEGYDFTTIREDRAQVPIEQAQVWSSEIVDKPGMHVLALDLDESARLVPSSTPGHYHLIIDKPIGWKAYQAILRAMGEAGLVEPGYVGASIARGATFLRLPWITKRNLDDKQKADRDAHNRAVEARADPGRGKFLRFNRDGLAMLVDGKPVKEPVSDDSFDDLLGF